MKKLIGIMVVMALVTGCASVKMEPKEASDRAKQFAQPGPGKSSLYVYRDSVVGQALKKDLWLNGECIGESAANVFFHTDVKPGKHTLSTESEFSPNDLPILIEAGKNYFYRQFIKIGLMVGGAGLESVPEEQAKAAITKLQLATPGSCSKPYAR